jgi:hypothetical protein
LVEREQISSGLHLKNQGQEVEISKESIEKLLDAFERLATRFLDWSGNHPYLFSLLVGLMAFWLFLRYRGRVQIARMKREFERERLQSQIPSLDLPEPTSRASPKRTRNE